MRLREEHQRLKKRLIQKQLKISDQNKKIKELKSRKLDVKELTKNMKPMAAALFENELKNGPRDPRGHSFEDIIKEFAFKQSFYSSRGYEFLRREVFTLPSLRSIRNYLAPVECAPGHLTGVIKHIQESYKDKMKRCTLVIDGMEIHKGACYDPQRKSFLGMCTPLDPNDEDSDEMATECLMFFLVSLDGQWRFPVGYWFTNHLSGTDAGNLVLESLRLTYEHDIHVRALVFDGLKANITMGESFGILKCI